MYAMSSDPFVRPFACYVALEQCVQSDFTVSRRYAEPRGEGREEREGRGRGGKRALGEARPISVPFVPNRIEHRSA